MAATTITVYSDETDPDTLMAWRNRTGLRDFTGWTLKAEVVNRETNAIVLNKTSGVTGSDGTGESNVNISWTAAELGGLTAGVLYELRVVATLGIDVATFTLDRNGTLPYLRVIAKPS